MTVGRTCRYFHGGCLLRLPVDAVVGTVHAVRLAATRRTPGPARRTSLARFERHFADQARARARGTREAGASVAPAIVKAHGTRCGNLSRGHVRGQLPLNRCSTTRPLAKGSLPWARAGSLRAELCLANAGRARTQLPGAPSCFAVTARSVSYSSHACTRCSAQRDRVPGCSLEKL